jgi:hypothetical protein
MSASITQLNECNSNGFRFALPTSYQFESLFRAFSEDDPIALDEREAACVNTALKDSLLKCLDTIQGYFWTSSTTSFSVCGAYRISFDKGVVLVSKTSKNQIRLVRRKAKYYRAQWKFGDDMSNRFEPSNCGLWVTDRLTGLEWKINCEAKSYSWHSVITEFKLFS